MDADSVRVSQKIRRSERMGRIEFGGNIAVRLSHGPGTSIADGWYAPHWTQ